MSKKQDIARLKKVFQRLIKENKAKVKDIEEIDFSAYVDGSLTYDENKEALFKEFAIPEVREEDYEDAQHEHIKAIENHYEEEFKKSVKELRGGEQEEFFRGLKDYVGMVGKGFANALIVEGKGGIGKTYEVLRTLSEKDVDYEYINSYSTPLEFYQLLYNHNGKVIILDDFEGVLSSNVGISILKSALWSATEKRIVSYFTSSDKLTVPSKFEFTGRVIFCLNSLTNNPEIRALKTRALYYNLNFSVKEIKKIIMAIAKSDDKRKLSQEERVEVADYIIENSTEATKELNLRTLIKAYGAFEYAKETGTDWKKLVGDLLETDEEKVLIREVLDKHSSVKDAIKEFVEATGKSRATFFRLKKEMGLLR